MDLASGERIRTSSSGEAVLTFLEGSDVQLLPDTELEMRDGDVQQGGRSVIAFKQFSGKTWNRVMALLDPESSYEVQTSSAYCLVRGTYFLVSVTDAGTSVEVDAGEVVVGAQGEEVAVPAGQQVDVFLGQAPDEPYDLGEDESESPAPQETEEETQDTAPTQVDVGQGEEDAATAPQFVDDDAGGDDGDGSDDSPILYSVTLASSVGGSVTTPLECDLQYARHTVVPIVANAEPGYRFAGWTGDTEDVDDTTSAATTLEVRRDCSITSTFEVANPGLTVSKSVSAATTVPGATVTYTIAYRNYGGPATGVSVSDDPDELYVASVSNVSSGGSYNGDIISWNIGNLDALASGALTYEVTLKGAGAFLAGTTIVTDTAAIESNESSPSTADESLAVQATALLTISKSVNPASARPGGVVTCTILFENIGNAAATNVVLVDDLEEGCVDSVSSISADGSYDGNVVTWSALPDVAPGTSSSVSYQATLKDAASGVFPAGATTVHNTATIDSDDTMPAADDHPLTVNAAPALNMSKTVSPGVTLPEGVVVYTIACSNTGDATATNVNLSDDPDETYVASVGAISGDGGYDGDIIHWSIGDLSAGDSCTFEYQTSLRDISFFPDGSTIVDNVAVLTNDWSAPVIRSRALAVHPIAGIAVTKSVSPEVATPGATVTYTVEYSNSGADVTGLTISDDPDELYVASVDNISSGGSYDGDTILWTIGNLNTGDSSTLTYEVTLEAAGAFPAGTTDVVNTVAFDSDATSPGSTSETLTVQANALHVVSTSVSPHSARPGDTVTYTITYENDGDATATGVFLVDDLDEGYVDSVSAISAGGSYDGGVVTWDPLPDLEPGDSNSVTYQVTLKNAASGVFPAGATTLHNTATIDSGDTASATAVRSLTVNAAPSLSIGKTVSPGVAKPGDTVTYTITCSNSGDAVATGVAVSDDPDETYVASVNSLTGGGAYDGDTISWGVGTLAAGSSVCLTYHAMLESPGSGAFPAATTMVVNTATLTSSETTPVSDNVTLTVEYTPVFARSLKVKSTDHGQVIVWTVGGIYTVHAKEEITVPCVLREWVIVIAEPDGGYHFKEWSRDDGHLVFGKYAPINAIIMNNNYKLEAHYNH